ncbi:MAG: hypothetical protein ACE367_02015 [Acidimicrobiales bacterium]
MSTADCATGTGPAARPDPADETDRPGEADTFEAPEGDHRTGAENRRPDDNPRRQNQWPAGLAPKTVAQATSFGARTLDPSKRATLRR